ncbi:NAD(+) diphosphatase [Rehaibacterium terrae]|uniref:NAD(+) diphosphatase n=1 Tax=Rehaibacterium terrae TaxID=1341696 RepID=A0A7W7XZS5_9GAMM|nr:NAD+ diphosphatase [Rehaibacterium terrae]
MTPTPTAQLFAGLPLDRAEHLREDVAALAALWPQARVIRLDPEGHAAARADGEGLALASGREFVDRFAQATFLGLSGGTPWFALDADPAGWPHWIDLRSAGARFSPFEAGLFAYARALGLWQRRSRFCPACGHRLGFARGGHVAECGNCGLEHYPRTDPAVIVLAESEGRVLLGRQPNWPAGQYSLIAGFVEPGESLEDAARRELAEETGIVAGACRYIASQPWPFPGTLMLGFRAEAEFMPPRVGRELEDARWFSADDIRREVAAGRLRLSSRISIARSLIDAWLAER